MKPLPRLYSIADASFGNPVELANSLFSGGARLVQVRNKKARAGELLKQVDRILVLAPKGAEVIVNDRVDVALISGAAGVHLGQKDVPPTEARHILGSRRVIGVSTHSLEQALEADKLAVDYIGVGPIFQTTTKENPDPVLGVEKLAEICSVVRKPVVAIGGIRLDNVEDVLLAGAASIAVIRDLLDNADVVSRVQRWIEVSERISHD
jgi:thiamine-phosphate pyrophosphorylase